MNLMVFDGRSRPQWQRHAHDHAATREEILRASEKRRKEREEAERKRLAALRLQKWWRVKRTHRLLFRIVSTYLLSWADASDSHATSVLPAYVDVCLHRAAELSDGQAVATNAVRGLKEAHHIRNVLVCCAFLFYYRREERGEASMTASCSSSIPSPSTESIGAMCFPPTSRGDVAFKAVVLSRIHSLLDQLLEHIFSPLRTHPSSTSGSEKEWTMMQLFFSCSPSSSDIPVVFEGVVGTVLEGSLVSFTQPIAVLLRPLTHVIWPVLETAMMKSTSSASIVRTLTASVFRVLLDWTHHLSEIEKRSGIISYETRVCHGVNEEHGYCPSSTTKVSSSENDRRRSLLSTVYEVLRSSAGWYSSDVKQQQFRANANEEVNEEAGVGQRVHLSTSSIVFGVGRPVPDFETTCWACLCAPPVEYPPATSAVSAWLTTDPAMVLTRVVQRAANHGGASNVQEPSYTAASGSVNDEGCSRYFELLESMVEVAFNRIVLQGRSACASTTPDIKSSSEIPCATPPSLSLKEAAHVLHHLTRLLPFFTALGRQPALLEGVSEGNVGTGAVTASRRARLLQRWATATHALMFSCCQTPSFMSDLLHDLNASTAAPCTSQNVANDGTAAGLASLSISSWFSLEGGLELLDTVARVDFVQLQCEGDNSEGAALLSTVCSVFGWPLYFFRRSASESYRRKTNVILSRFIRSPRIMRFLWQFYERIGLRSRSSRASCALFADPNPALSVFTLTVLLYYVEMTNFSENVRRKTVFSPEELKHFIEYLRSVVFQSHVFGVAGQSRSGAVAWLVLQLLRKLYEVNESDPVVQDTSVWLFEDLPVWMKRVEDGSSPFLTRLNEPDPYDPVEIDSEEDKETVSHEAVESIPLQQLGDDRAFEGSARWSSDDRCLLLLRRAPFVFDFRIRAMLFSHFVYSLESNSVPLSLLLHRDDSVIKVRRSSVFSDAFLLFRNKSNSPEMRYIRFQDDFGELEAGFGQGVYREFMVQACRQGFAPEYGLFNQTSAGRLYPNPLSREATGDEAHVEKFRFLGALLGRAMRDGIVQDIPLAAHFINILLGRRNTFTQLKGFDPELHRQLLTLPECARRSGPSDGEATEGELESMGLTFTTVVDALGVMKEVELIPGGRDVAVTRHNCFQYIALVGDFYLNRQGAVQARAFQNGLHSIVPAAMLELFDVGETVRIICGDNSGMIDVEDWRKHTTYHDPNDASHPSVVLFWQVVESLTSEQRSKLLRFATSMNYPPLLGFKYLSPPFSIHLLKTEAPDIRLPSASTCFSQLKLPLYTSFHTAREKILVAIEGSSTFEMS